MELPKKILDLNFLEKIQNAVLSKNKTIFREILATTLSYEEAIDYSADLSDIIDRLHFVKNKRQTPLIQQFNKIFTTSKKLAGANKILLYRIKVAKYYIKNYKDLLTN